MSEPATHIFPACALFDWASRKGIEICTYKNYYKEFIFIVDFERKEVSYSSFKHSLYGIVG